MSLAHAILGLLQEQPMTGYELKTNCFDQSIAHFWPADQAQIYRTLDKMAEQAWVVSEIVFQENKPNRKIYTITETGRSELTRWLQEFQPRPVHREPFLIRLFFAAQLRNATIITLIEEQLKAHQAMLAHYEEMRLGWPDIPGPIRDLALQAQTLEMGIQFERMCIDWLQDTMRVVEGLAEEKTD
jgi:PadR family transcriptional regulator AphA